VCVCVCVFFFDVEILAKVLKKEKNDLKLL